MDALIILAAIAVVALPGILFFFLQHRLVFAPNYYPERSFFAEHSQDYRLMWLKVDPQVELEGIVYSPQNARHTVLYFGGKDQDSVALVAKLSEQYPHIRLIAFNYRGYGHSGGKPTEVSLYSDALAAYDWAAEQYRFVDMLGYSLGASVASYVASKRRTGKVVLVAAFDSVKALLDAKVIPLPKWMFRYKFDTADHIRSVVAPVYLYTSSDDELVPPSKVSGVRSNIKYLAGSKEFSGYNHAQLLFSDELKHELDKVFER